ncbi:MAG: sigma-54-dependent Fis family transcriptional regulator, partial [Planctomycetota bacterium]
LDLYQLSLMLMSRRDGDDVLETVLELLRDRTQATSVCLFHHPSDGVVALHACAPKDGGDLIRVSRRLVKRIHKQKEAMWIGRDEDSSLRDEIKSKNAMEWSDVIYCPILHEDQPIGLLQVFRESSRFDEQHFDFAVVASRLLAVGLVQGQERDSLVAERRHLAERNAENSELIGSCSLMTKLKERISRVGRANGSVLIRGESGSGKELVARAVHRASPRVERPMLTVNCAAIPQDLIESQLFGHKKGSFTGADADHVGWFQQAHTGTLFLDEIGELTLEGQAKLLRILEGHPFLPVGATEQVLVDVRVIAATNRDLAEFVREGKFREDLFYRLSVFELLVPPLRDRQEDVNALIDHFLNHFCRQHGRSNLKLSKDARERMLSYAWPGNVRQLRNVIDSAIVMADDPEIRGEDLGLRDAGISRLDTLRIDEWERRLIRQALEKTGGSVPEAAKLLGISRATAYRKITEYEIER